MVPPAIEFDHIIERTDSSEFKYDLFSIAWRQAIAVSCAFNCDVASSWVFGWLISPYQDLRRWRHDTRDCRAA